MTWLVLLGANILIVMDWIEESKNEDIERVPLEKYPLVVAWVMVFTRCLIVSIRHATSSVGQWISSKEQKLSQDQITERLISRAWIVMPPEVCAVEIEKSMVKIGASEKFFVWRPLTPIYPTMIQRLTDPEYWNKFGWTHKKALTFERRKQKQMELIMTNFQHNLIFEKEEIAKNCKGEMPKEFDMDFTFLSSLIFQDNNYDDKIVLPGKLWLVDLFMKA